MLKTVSAITNAIGALNYKGTWNATTNTPALASGVGTKGDYYVVSVAGSTTLNGISNWGVGDWVAFNGSAWQRVEGGADLNGVNLSVSGTSTFGDNATFGTAAKGVNFTANTPAAGMTSQLLNWYEQGTFTPTLGGTATYFAQTGKYTRIGNTVYFSIAVIVDSLGTGSATEVSGLPFTSAANTEQGVSITYFNNLGTSVVSIYGSVDGAKVVLRSMTAAGTALATNALFANFADIRMTGFYFV